MNSKGIALTIGGVLAVLLLCVGLAFSVPVFTVKTIAVEGNGHLSQEQVAEASGLVVGENLLRVDARAAASGVAGLPWVKEVTVARSFPSTVHVSLTEREAVAYSDQPDGPHLIDATGNEFVIDLPPEGAVRLVGGESGSVNWQHAIEIAAAIPDELRAQAEEIETADPYNFVIRMKDGRRIIWGASEDNADKARAMATVLKMHEAKPEDPAQDPAQDPNADPAQDPAAGFADAADKQEWNISNPELVTAR